eukprot:1158571-Pelagomonas_calceolata.AAC.3
MRCGQPQWPRNGVQGSHTIQDVKNCFELVGTGAGFKLRDQSLSVIIGLPLINDRSFLLSCLSTAFLPGRCDNNRKAQAPERKQHNLLCTTLQPLKGDLCCKAHTGWITSGCLRPTAPSN